MKNVKNAFYLFAGIILITSCRNILEQATSITDEFTIDVIKTVSYEVESVTTRLTKKKGDVKEIDQIRAMPSISREGVRYGIDKYGATEIFIDILTPEQKLPADDMPPNTFVEATHIHIVHGIGSFYDNSRNLLYSHPMNGTNMPEIEQLSAKKGDVDKMLEVAKENGAIINDLGEGFISVRMSNEQFATAEANEATENTYTVTIFNTTTNVPIGSVIYDNSDKMLFRMYVQTEINASGNLVLKATQQEVFDVDPNTNLPTMIRTNSVYTNVIIENLQ